jgi:argininosuccinate lyase
LELERALVGLADRHRDAVMPGHTHVQPAQPVLFAHHLLAYVEMIERDRARFADARARASLSPLGSGALAGAGFKLDREAVAAELGFAGVTRNSIDAVGDRDPVVETISAAALAMAHLSRLAEELVWWSNPGFGFIRAADAWSTGSSMMPNKRNPDPAELVRGRSARVTGHLVTALTMLKGIPAGYQRDLQEDKPPLVDALSVLESSLLVMAGMVASLHVNEERMLAAATSGYTTATAVADALVELGVPFREGHHFVGSLVARAEASGSELTELSDGDIAEALAASGDAVAQALATDPVAAPELRAAATLENALARPDVIGGTAPARVHAELDAAIARLSLADAQ